jgi:NAD(P)H-flavin reductase
MVPLPAPILRVTRETADTVTLRLGPPGGRLPFVPGQFNMLYLFGVGEVAVSLSGDPARDGEVVHTLRGVGSVTRPMVVLRRGAVLRVRGPYGRGWPLEELRGRDVLLVAGGIGLAPLRPVLYSILARRGDYGRVTVLYGARSPRELLYRRELARWRRRRDLDLGVIVDHADLSWDGEVGVVTALLAQAPLEADRVVALLCGPEVMMRFTVRDLLARGIPAEAIHVSLERNMKCALGHCGRCQLAPIFVCKDGPVLRFDRIAPFFGRREL